MPSEMTPTKQPQARSIRFCNGGIAPGVHTTTMDAQRGQGGNGMSEVQRQDEDAHNTEGCPADDVRELEDMRDGGDTRSGEPD